jgi:hypothetical protein
MDLVESLLFSLSNGSCADPVTALCEVSRRPTEGENFDIAIDSTGLKVYGEGGRLAGMDGQNAVHGISPSRH